MKQTIDIEDIKQKIIKKLEPSGWHRPLRSFIFSSDFESGNLDLVIYNEKLNYDLYMRVDSNSEGHN